MHARPSRRPRPYPRPRPRLHSCPHPRPRRQQARISRGHIIASVGGVPTPDLDTFVRLMRSAPHGKQLAVRFFDLSQRTHMHLTSLTIDRRWWAPPIWSAALYAQPLLCAQHYLPRPPRDIRFPLADSQRGDPRMCGATWSTTTVAPTIPVAIPSGPPAVGAMPTSNDAPDTRTTATAATAIAAANAATAATGIVEASVPRAPEPAECTASQAADRSTSSVGDRLAPALVTVDFTRPFAIDGETGMRYRGAGDHLDRPHPGPYPHSSLSTSSSIHTPHPPLTQLHPYPHPHQA